MPYAIVEAGIIGLARYATLEQAQAECDRLNDEHPEDVGDGCASVIEIEEATQGREMTRDEKLALARAIERRADKDGILQADQVAELRVQPELCRAIHMIRLADALGVRDELDQVCS